jgi:hypothetical protein
MILRQKPSANASGFDCILAPPSRVLVSQHRPTSLCQCVSSF